MPSHHNVLKARRLHIDTYQEPVVYMRSDCHICRSEGFEAQSRLAISCAGAEVIATLNVVSNSILGVGELGLSESAWRKLGVADGTELGISHARPLDSFSAVRGKIYGRRFGQQDIDAIIHDVVTGLYSDIELAAFITACAGQRLDLQEMIALTQSMVAVGGRIDWGKTPILDKHCVGGLPGNRTTMLVVPIVAACGLTIPKTSSRAITSPAGTADAMETVAPVELDLATMRRVVEKEGGCIAWGGAVNLSPADDILIRVERPLDLDSEGQLVASVLSKKIAAGSTDVLLDIPVGATAKVRSIEAAAGLSAALHAVGAAMGLRIRTLVTDGTHPVGRGIGPALEALDVLAVLRGAADAPADLRSRALMLAGGVLEMGNAAGLGEGEALAEDILNSGRAWAKFQAICEAQGGMREPALARYSALIVAQGNGIVREVDNRRLARLAKLAGAPKAASAGVRFHAPVGSRVEQGQPLITVFAESPGELAYAMNYADRQQQLIELETP